MSLAAPGDFAMACGEAETVIMRAYLDLDNNGPDGTDVRIELKGPMLTIPEEGLQGIVVDLDARTLSTD